ncbi:MULTISPECIES: hypothetical protein [unclassified Desulfovibrio]|uniref:hypothetical protein n=1 Tax=unclassified Desulfovibrio TaxID=2593640 RepID=UPI002FDA79F4
MAKIKKPHISRLFGYNRLFLLIFYFLSCPLFSLVFPLKTIYSQLACGAGVGQINKGKLLWQQEGKDIAPRILVYFTI